MRNDFTKRECRIQEQMAEVFQRMAGDSTIEFPKPDLSFMEEGTVPGAAEAAGGEMKFIQSGVLAFYGERARYYVFSVRYLFRQAVWRY